MNIFTGPGGEGVDIVYAPKIAESIARERLVMKTFTLTEISDCIEAPHPSKKFAEKFAIKEACMKALGSGIEQGVWFTQIESCMYKYWSIEIRVYRTAKDIFETRNVLQSQVSITGTSDLVVAMVALERGK